MGATARHEGFGGDADDASVPLDEHLASQITLDRPGERAYLRALAFFLGSLVAAAVPAFLSAGVALLDPPWHVTAPITALYVALALSRARRAAHELATPPSRRRTIQVVLLHATAILFAGLGGATLSWETARLVDHRLDGDPGQVAVAQRVALTDGGDRAEYRVVDGDGGTFVVRGGPGPETRIVRVHRGALGYRWVAPD